MTLTSACWNSHPCVGVTASSIGLGFINWQMSEEAIDAAISCRPGVVWLAFPSAGREFGAFVPRFKEAGCKVFCMVQTLDQAEEVVRLLIGGNCHACAVSIGRRANHGPVQEDIVDDSCWLLPRFLIQQLDGGLLCKLYVRRW